MRIVIQRVCEASVTLRDTAEKRSIGRGMMVLLGIEEADNQSDLDWLTKKLLDLRIFSDDAGKMNLSLRDIGGELLIVSQFTLHASTKKGNRPSFIRAAKPDIAVDLYRHFIRAIEAEGIACQTGEFGADMLVTLTNDGPVTIIIDSKNRE